MISEYDSSFLCTYKNIDDDDLYRIQFLQAFKISTWDDKLINSTRHKLYLSTKDKFVDILKDMKNKKHILSHALLFLGGNPNDFDLFSLLFCMDIFQEFHKCLCDILNTGTLKKENLKNLSNVLFDN